MEIRLVLEEVEMPPSPLQGVVDVAFLGLLAEGQGNLAPLTKSIQRSSRPSSLENLRSETCQGLESPRARVNKPSSSIEAFPFKVGFASNLITAARPL
jgi:hypothetical protein